MSRVILGGGISGLSSAYYLSKFVPNQPPVIVEASDRLGGWIKSNILNNNVIFEQGPRTIRPTGPTGANTLSMIEDLGITDQIWPISFSHPAAKNRMILAKGRLHSLPSTISSVFRTQSPFTKPLIVYLARDLFAAKKPVPDEPIYDFINRRFGEEFADYLISPLICGICAGDAKEISVNFLMKTPFEYEQKYGSICRGLARNVFSKRKVDQPEGLALRAKKERWQIYSFRNGMETLPKALERYVKQSGTDIWLNSECKRIEFQQDEVVLYFEGEKSLKARHVISCLPSERLGTIVRAQHPDLANLLCEIKTVSVAVVNLCYTDNLIEKPGFGFLVPPKENVPILGVIYDSCCFPRGDSTVLSVMMGGRWFEKLFGANPTDDGLLGTAEEQIRNILGISQQPTHFKVSVLKKCIPQYTVGHCERVEAIEEYIRKKRLPLSVCGASYHGVGVNDVIMSARNAVNNLLTINS